MEILYWFFFFATMIFLSYLTWFQIFGLFILIIFVTNQVNLFSYLTYIYQLINKILKNFYKTGLGFYLYSKLLVLEKSYQFTKSLIKNEVMKILIGNSRIRNFTPRLSQDVEDTDSD